MHHRLIKVVLALLALAIAGALLAQMRDVSTARVSLNLQGAELYTALQLLTKQTGAEICFKPTDKPYSKVNVNLTDRSFETALLAICMSAGAEYEKNEDGVYFIQPAGTRPAQQLSSDNVYTTSVVPKPRMRIEKIALKFMDARDVMRAIFSGGNNPESLSASQVQALVHRSIPRVLVNNPTVITPVVPAVPIEGASSSNDTGANRSSDLDLSDNQYGGRGPGGSFPGAPTTPAISNTPGATSAASGLLPPDVDSVQAFLVDNSLIVKGTDEGIEELKRLVRIFDVRAKQVLIKVEFITAQASLSKSFGINWNFSRVNVTGGTSGFAGGDPVFLNYASGNVIANLRTRLIEGKGRVVNSPIVTTMNNVPAVIQEELSLTYFVNQSTITGTGNQIAFPTPIQIPVTTSLQVTPRINADGTVTLMLAPQISDLGQLRKSPDGTEIPDTVTQYVQCLRTIKSGETMVLGGLTRKTETSSVNKVPILADLPIIGSLFRSKSSTREDSELLIFVTPVVLPDPDTGNQVSIEP